MDGAIADRVCDERVAELVAALRFQLAGEDRGPVAVAVFEDLEDVAPLGGER